MTNSLLTTSLALLSFFLLSLLLSCTGTTNTNTDSTSNSSKIVIINTAAELQAITNNIVTLNSISYNADGTNNTGATGKHIAGNYQLAGNIDLSGMTDFTPIGSKTIPFIGVFDGKGYEVTLNINTAKSYVGLFGYVGINEAYTDNTTAVSNRNNAIEIKNIGVSGTITNIGGYVGGLAGQQNGGSIIGYSKATVASTGGNTSRNIGGLLGYQNGGSIIGYATGAISGDSAVGGLVGAQSIADNQSIVGYATGAVSSPAGYVGGFLGNRAEQGILTGYSTGSSTGSPFLGGNLYPAQGTYFDASNNGNRSDRLATNISAAANIYKFAGPTETGRTVGKFYDKATGTSATAEDSGDNEIFTESEFIDAFDLENTPNGRFPKLKTSLFGTLPQP